MDNFLIFGIWLLIAFIASHIAKRKGRSRLHWFFIVFATSLIGLLILVFLPTITIL